MYEVEERHDNDLPPGCASFIAALGLALLLVFHMLSLRALSLGDSVIFGLSFDPPLFPLPKENPLEFCLGRGEVGVVGTCKLGSMMEDA